MRKKKERVKKLEGWGGRARRLSNNAALNILAAGQAVSACGAGRAQAPASKQEPAYGAAR